MIVRIHIGFYSIMGFHLHLRCKNNEAFRVHIGEPNYTAAKSEGIDAQTQYTAIRTF